MTSRNTRPSVLSLGYCTLDVIRKDGSISHRAGGTAANVAANLAFLGWDASYAGRLGTDPAGRRIVEDLRRGGVNGSLIERDEAVQSPVIVHEVASSRHTFLFRCPDCGRRFPRHRPISDAQFAALADAVPSVDVFFFDRASAPALRLAGYLRERGSVIMFEPSAPGVPARTLAAAEAAHIVKCSHDRREQIDPRVMSPRPGQLQIETLGAQGLRFRREKKAWMAVPAFEVEAVDAGGAGDWLTAALLTEITPASSAPEHDDAMVAILRRAQAIAALSSLFVGARTLARLPLREVKRASAQLLAGDRPGLPAATPGRRSRSKAECRTCLS